MAQRPFQLPGHRPLLRQEEREEAYSQLRSLWPLRGLLMLLSITKASKCRDDFGCHGYCEELWLSTMILGASRVSVDAFGCLRVCVL